MRGSRGGVLEFLFGCALLAAACGGSKGASCPQGTESCPCYGNSTCNTGLDCRSNVCVNLGGAGGGGGGGQSGAPGAGGKGGTGTGGNDIGGGSGGSVVGDASLDVSDGPMCTNTASDPKNCGSCGHVCKNADPVFNSRCPPNGCCVGGQCGPTFSACFGQGQATNCADYCTSIGETCVQDGCALGGLTWFAAGTLNACNVFHTPPEAQGAGACTTPIPFDNGTIVQVRCCCTDTH